MERRVDKRRARRVPVRFWKRGEEKARPGFTTNISNCGMFIGTNVVLGRGTRLRVEVIDSHHGFVVEGVVARAIRNQLGVQSLQPTGMGIRFLQVAELVEDLFPARHVPEEEVAAPPPPAGAPESAVAPQAPQHPVYRVQFRSREELRSCFERDISKGGLFVTTPQPAALQQVVTIEITMADGPPEPVRLLAKVVHCVESQAGEEANLLAGIGLELLDPAQAHDALRPLVGDAAG